MTRDEERRKARNAHVLDLLASGDNLCHTGLSAYRWQPRPIIKKDLATIRKLQGLEPPALVLIGDTWEP